MNQLANLIALSGGTGTAAATINYANAVCKVLNLSLDIASNILIAMNKKSEPTFYRSLRYFPFAINSSVTQNNIVFTPFVENIVGFILLFVR